MSNESSECENSIGADFNLKSDSGSKVDEDPLFNCSQCGKSFANEHTLQKHVTIHSDAEVPVACHSTNENRRDGSNTAKPPRARQKKPLKSSKRSEPNVSERSTPQDKNRPQNHATDLDVECDICHKIFTDKKYIYSHMKTHIDNQLDCDICHKSLKGKRNLLAHIRSMHSDAATSRNQLCENCGRAFQSRTMLSNHILAVHSTERPFACRKCNQKFRCVP